MPHYDSSVRNVRFAKFHTLFWREYQIALGKFFSKSPKRWWIKFFFLVENSPFICTQTRERLVRQKTLLKNCSPTIVLQLCELQNSKRASFDLARWGDVCAREKTETGSCLNACANDKSVTVIGGVTLTALGSTNDNTNGSNVDGSGDGSRGLDSDKPPWPAVISVNCRRGHFSLHGLGFCPGRRRCKYP